MTATPLSQASVNVLPPPAISARRTRALIITAPPEDHLFVDRHCPDCGALTPHHDNHCFAKWEE